MPEKRIPSVRISEEMFEAIEDIFHSERLSTRSECVRWLLERAFEDLLHNQNGPLPRIEVSGATSKDLSVQLSEKLFEKLEDFRHTHKILSRAEAIRILLNHALQKYQRGQLSIKK